MQRIIAIIRSETFLALAGGFALGLAGMSVVKPASADSSIESGRNISVYVPHVEEPK